MKKTAVCILTCIALLGLTSGIKAQGPQAGLPYMDAYSLMSNLQNSRTSVAPVRTSGPLSMSPLSFGLPMPGMIFPYAGLLGGPGPAAVFPPYGGFGFSGPAAVFPPYVGFGYSPGLAYPGPGLFSPYNIPSLGYPTSLGYSSGVGFPGMVPSYSGPLGVPGSMIPPMQGHSSLATIAQPGYWEAGKISFEASGQEFPIFMPPASYEDYTMNDLVYQGQLGVPIPGTTVRFTIPGEGEYDYQLCQDAYSGAIYPVWNKNWWCSSSSGQTSGSEK